MVVLTGVYAHAFVDRVILALLVGPIKADLHIGDVEMSLPLGRSSDDMDCGTSSERDAHERPDTIDCKTPYPIAVAWFSRNSVDTSTADNGDDSQLQDPSNTSAPP